MLSALAQSMVIAFAMYSAIPCPQVSWNEKNMRWSMCFFPLIGVFIGLAVNGWFLLAGRLHTGPVLRTCVLCALPVLLTGGIHLDGFLDTTDALASHRPREEKLRILKDPSCGAFAVIGCVVYFLLQFGAVYELQAGDVKIAGCGFVLSRALSAFGVVTFPKAGEKGTLRTFSDTAGKKAVRVTSLLWAAAAAAGMIFQNPVKGGLAAVLALAVFGWCYRMNRKEFGGITGDLAGYFLQLCELVMLLGIACC